MGTDLVIRSTVTIEKYKWDAWDLIKDTLENEWVELVELGKRRAATIGEAEYGERAWGKSFLELLQEGREEIADLIFYFCVASEVAET